MRSSQCAAFGPDERPSPVALPLACRVQPQGGTRGEKIKAAYDLMQLALELRYAIDRNYRSTCPGVFAECRVDALLRYTNKIGVAPAMITTIRKDSVGPGLRAPGPQSVPPGRARVLAGALDFREGDRSGGMSASVDFYFAGGGATQLVRS
jgi:hypothetical protein